MTSADLLYQYTPNDLAYFVGHWTEAEIAATGATPQCIAAFLGYLERVTETQPSKANKKMVIRHIKQRLRDDPSYDRWRVSGT